MYIFNDFAACFGVQNHDKICESGWCCWGTFRRRAEKVAFDIASMEAEKLKSSTPFIIIPQGTPAILMVGNTLEIQ